MRVCEDMARMVCGTSNLKCDDPKLRKETLSNRACTLCDFGIEENTVHLVMQCPYHEATRICMYNDIDKLQVETCYIQWTSRWGEIPNPHGKEYYDYWPGWYAESMDYIGISY